MSVEIVVVKNNRRMWQTTDSESTDNENLLSRITLYGLELGLYICREHVLCLCNNFGENISPTFTVIEERITRMYIKNTEWKNRPHTEQLSVEFSQSKRSEETSTLQSKLWLKCILNVLRESVEWILKA
jgi:hypothetical protein